MSDCCTNAGCEVERLRGRQSRTLKVVLGVNLTMFAVELTAGILAASTALLADSLDMLGDALVYGFSLYVVARDDLWKARAALAKGAIMAGFGLFVLGQAAYKMVNPAIPAAEVIGLVGLVALLANAGCFWLLWRHRAEDVNMRSVWLCSRNDLVANAAVIAAGVAVWLAGSQWPDILVGVAIAVLFLHSAVQVFRDALATRKQYRASRGTVTFPPGGAP